MVLTSYEKENCLKVGYARISTTGQTHDAQVDALTRAGCERIFIETASGSRSDRPVLKEALEFLRPQDMLIVTKLDRAARSLRHLLDIMDRLSQRGIEFVSLTEALDTSSPGGKLVFSIFGAIAEFERSLIVERTQAGLAAARQRGRTGGRPRKMTDAKIKAAKKLLAGDHSTSEVAAMLGVSVPTLFRHCPASQR